MAGINASESFPLPISSSQNTWLISSSQKAFSFGQKSSKFTEAFQQFWAHTLNSVCAVAGNWKINCFMAYQKLLMPENLCGCAAISVLAQKTFLCLCTFKMCCIIIWWRISSHHILNLSKWQKSCQFPAKCDWIGMQDYCAIQKKPLGTYCFTHCCFQCQSRLSTPLCN